MSLFTIKSYIETGTPISDNYYRASSDRRGDDLLVKSGIMHLHLTHPHDDFILYLMQFDDFVLFIEVSTHAHLQKVPIGSSFNMYSIKKRIIEIQNKISDEKQQKQKELEKTSNHIKTILFKNKPMESWTEFFTNWNKLYEWFYRIK